MQLILILTGICLTANALSIHGSAGNGFDIHEIFYLHWV